MGDPKQHFTFKTIAISLFTAIVIISAAFIALNYYQISKREMIMLENRADEYIDIITGMLEVPLWDFDRENIKTICTYHFHNDWIAMVSLTSTSGEKLYERKKKIETKENDLINRSKDIIHDGEFIGTIKIAITPQRREEFTKQLLIASVSALFISVLGLIIATSMVARRTKELERTNMRFRHEIDERKQTLSLLRASENEYRSTLDNLLIGVVVHDSDTSIIFCNPEATNILGLTYEQMLGKKTIDPAWSFLHEDLTIINVEDYPVSKVFSTKRPLYNYVLGINRPDRDYVTWGLVNAIPVFSNNNELEKVIVNFIDITDSKQAELEKEKLESQLRQAAKIEAVGTLAGGIAHDFNNILGIIIGNTELAFDDVPDWNPAKKNLKEIKTASFRARDVVRQLLSFSRKTEQEKRPTKIQTIIKESVHLLRASIPSSVELRSNIPARLRPIMADPTQIHQIAINLCTNAAHAMEDNGGTLEISLDEIELDELFSSKYPNVESGLYIQLTVSDSGCGINPIIMDRIFDPYFTTKEIDKGTGIGLSVVHGIVKNHDGAISVYSEPDKGTTIKVIFPVVDSEPVQGKINSKELPTGNEKILFVDDEKPLTKIGKQILERLGYQVVIKNNPIEALEQFRSNPSMFDLVITDMTMPQMTGDKFVTELLKIKPDLPIILCTGFSKRISRESAVEFGIRKYIEKPLNKRELSISIREVLDKK